MKALSIRQPWAWLIIRPDVHDPKKRALLRSMGQIKDIENRAWPAPPQGRIAIHASRTFDRAGYEWVRACLPEIDMPTPEQFERGGIVGTVTHGGSVDAHDSPWFEGPHGHILTEARPCRFVRLPGHLMFFQVPAGTVRYVE